MIRNLLGDNQERGDCSFPYKSTIVGEFCQLEKKVKNYWMNPYMNGDWSTIFPTAIDLLVQYIRQLTGSSDDTSNINTIRRHIVNRQNEIVAVD